MIYNPNVDLVNDNVYTKFGLNKPIRRPVYIESCACVVKDAVKCSFECLSVVHHTCRIHSVGIGDGEMIK